MMKAQSGTWNGMISTFRDGLNGVFRDFGTPILPSLKPILQDGISLTEQLSATAKQWGENIAQGITVLRGASAAGQLGEVMGLSLRVGFSGAVDFLKEKMAGIFAGISGTVGGLFAGLAEVFAGIGLQVGATITESIVSAVKDLKIGGVRVLSESSTATTSAVATGTKLAGSARVDAGLRGVTATIGQGIAGFIGGISEETKTANAKLKEAINKFRIPTAAVGTPEMYGPSWKDLHAGVGSVSAITASPQGNPLTDRLAKIGGFIGGSGGARGERAAQDTALNTAKLVGLQGSMLDHIRKLQPSSGTFA